MAQTIKPQSFSRFSSKSYVRSYGTEWDPAVLKVVAELLVGHRVVVEVDAHTGHAVEAVVLGWKNSTLHSSYPHLTVEDVHGNRTNYRVSSLGVIMDVEDTSARWTAERILSDRGADAIKAVRQHLGADWVVLEGEGTGRWETRFSTDGSVTVSAVRNGGDHAGVPFAHWYVTDGVVSQGANAVRLIRNGQMKLRHDG